MPNVKNTTSVLHCWTGVLLRADLTAIPPFLAKRLGWPCPVRSALKRTPMHNTWIHYWMGYEKSNFLKLGSNWKTTALGNKNLILYFYLFMGQVGAIFGLRRPKDGQKKNFKIVNFQLHFVSIVIRIFKIYNWCIGLFSHFCWITGEFKIQILYLDQIWTKIWTKLWAQKAKNDIAKSLIFSCSWGLIMSSWLSAGFGLFETCQKTYR